MSFEWDETKRQTNLAKHHYDFKTATHIWVGAVFEYPDTRHDYGEDRIVAYGNISGVVLAVVYTWRGNVRRIISARRADRDERRNYHTLCARFGQGP